jgi:hypothetical protein
MNRTVSLWQMCRLLLSSLLVFACAFGLSAQARASTSNTVAPIGFYARCITQVALRKMRNCEYHTTFPFTGSRGIQPGARAKAGSHGHLDRPPYF